MIHFLLCGGSGTRLWPISRKNFPKQFCKLIGDKSLFQYSVLRNMELCSEQLIIANKENVFMAMDQISSVKKNTSNSVKYVLEPVGRNTAPAIALGCFMCKPEDIILVTPTDHMIQNLPEYDKAMAYAKHEAEQGYLVTFGINPTSPETGYGYIEGDGSGKPVQNVASFREKPNLETAESYIKSGKYYWNSGMFCFKAGVFLDELKNFSPEIYEASKTAFEQSTIEDCICNIQYDDMLSIPENSIDYAVMEQSSKVKVIPSSFIWNDVGSYDALFSEIPTPEDGNTALVNHININSKNNMIFSDKVIATVDVEDLIIIDTIDAILISKRGSSQKVKDVVAELAKRGADDKKYINLTEVHTTAYRPWGSYTVLEEWPRFKMKRIVVQPGKRLSLQKHNHRSEHWIVVSGSAIVTKGDTEHFLKPNESIYIPIGETHRIQNPGKIDLVFLEVQVGEYLGEDDIVRFQDDFGRKD
jgi:mannose-1-phosphate guanylyltransferase